MVYLKEKALGVIIFVPEIFGTDTRNKEIDVNGFFQILKYIVSRKPIMLTYDLFTSPPHYLLLPLKLGTCRK